MNKLTNLEYVQLLNYVKSTIHSGQHHFNNVKININKSDKSVLFLIKYAINYIFCKVIENHQLSIFDIIIKISYIDLTYNKYLPIDICLIAHDLRYIYTNVQMNSSLYENYYYMLSKLLEFKDLNITKKQLDFCCENWMTSKKMTNLVLNYINISTLIKKQ